MLSHKGQSLVEYALIIAVVTAALIAMQFYIKRGTEGRLRTYADEVSGGNTFYAPKKTTGDSLITREIHETSSQETNEVTSASGEKDEETVTTSTFDQKQNVIRNEQVDP